MIADSRRDQTDLISLRAPLLRLRQNIARRHDARRPIIKTRPAEATALRATARNFDEEAFAHLRFRGPDDSRRREHLLRAQLLRDLKLTAPQRTPERPFLRILGCNRAPDALRHARLDRRVSRNRAVLVVSDLVERRHI